MSFRSDRSLSFLPAVLVLFATATGAQTTHIWPSADCSATLQDCIAAAANGDIVVVGNAPITNEISIPKPLTLIAAPGVRPTLAAGASISAGYNPGPNVDWSVWIEGFTLPQGNVTVFVSSGNATVTMRRLDVTATNVPHTIIGPDAIGIQNAGTGHVNYRVEANHLRVNSTDDMRGIEVYSTGSGSIEGSIHDNRIEALSAVPGNIGIFLGSGSQPNNFVYANQISGNLSTGMLHESDGPSNLILVSNVFRSASTGGFGLELATQTSNVSVFNNTFENFDQGLAVLGNAVAGRLSGNLFAHDRSIAIHQQGGTTTEDHSLFFDSAAPLTLGAGSIVADPKFRHDPDDLRLTQGSPAIGAADGSALAAVLANASLPQIDADGSRRFKNAAGTADIGAFAFGDDALIELATAANAGTIDNASLNGNSAALPQLVENMNPDGYQAIFDPGATGLQFATNRFHVIDESDGSGPTPGSAYNVFAPGAGRGAFLHVSSAGNVAGFTTVLNNTFVNGHPERIVLATHRATPLFNHPFGLAFGSGSWSIRQLDAQNGDPNFPSGLNFHIYAQDPSLNAFVWTAPAAGTATAIDHVLLNGEPCGRLYVSNANGNPHPVGVAYAQSRWSIVNLDGGAMPSGSQFHVVVDEAATTFCRRDHLFHDGFEMN